MTIESKELLILGKKMERFYTLSDCFGVEEAERILQRDCQFNPKPGFEPERGEEKMSFKP